MGLRELLKEDESLEIVTEARAGDEAVEKAREYRPDVILLDVLMPRMNGIEVARQLNRELPQTRIVMLSAVEDDERIFDALQAGASGYVVKDDPGQGMLQAIHSASEGKAYLPPRVAKRVLDRLTSRQPSGSRLSPALTKRETTVLKLIAQGKRNREIAAELGISERTVANHLANIYSKLGIKDRVQATLYAIRKGLMEI